MTAYCWLNIRTVRDWRQAGAAKGSARQGAAEELFGAIELGSFDGTTADQPGACMRRLVESRGARFRQGASAGLQVGILVSGDFLGVPADPARLAVLRDRGLAWATDKFGHEAIAAWRLVPDRASPRLELFVTPVVERKGRGGASKREVAVSHIMGKPHERKLSLMQDQLAAAFADLGLQRRGAAGSSGPAAPEIIVRPEPRAPETLTELARRAAAVTERERVAALRENTLQGLTAEVNRQSQAVDNAKRLLAGQEKNVASREAAVAAREAALKELEVKTAELQRQLGLRDAAMENAQREFEVARKKLLQDQTALAKKEIASAQKTETVVTREELAAKRETAIQQRESVVASKDRQFAERERNLERRATELTLREGRVASREAELTRRTGFTPREFEPT